MNNKLLPFSLLLAATTFFNSCKEQNRELKIAEFSGIYPETPAHEAFCSIYFLDSTGKRIDSTSLPISDSVSEKFKLRRSGPDSIWKAPNRVVIAEIIGKGSSKTVEKAKPMGHSTEVLSHWQKMISNEDSAKTIFGRNK